MKQCKNRMTFIIYEFTHTFMLKTYGRTNLRIHQFEKPTAGEILSKYVLRQKSMFSSGYC